MPNTTSIQYADDGTINVLGWTWSIQAAPAWLAPLLLITGGVLMSSAMAVEAVLDGRASHRGVAVFEALLALDLPADAPVMKAIGVSELGAHMHGDLSLDDLRGKVVLLEFWASWCSGCIDGLPQLRELYERHAGDAGLEIVGISLDENPRDFRRATP